MARVFWDTNLFIYLFEKNDEWSPRVIDLRKRMRARQDELLTSWLTVGEALTKPRDAGNPLLEKSYLNFFSSGSVELVPFASEAAKRYADIRSRGQGQARGRDSTGLRRCRRNRSLRDE